MKEQDKEIIYRCVDHVLEGMQACNSMYLPLENMPLEMMDQSRPPFENWIPWKPIKSTVTDQDLKEIEGYSGHAFPESFKAFLQYKHFYTLYGPTPGGVGFFQHPIHDWKQAYISYYSDAWVQKELLQKGYLPFGEYLDWGILCFDANRARINHEYPIIMIDYEVGDEDSIPFQEFNESFLEMLKQRLLSN